MSFATVGAFVLSFLSPDMPRQQIVHVSVGASNEASSTSRFEIGAGRAISVFVSPGRNTHAIPLGNNEILVFAEGDVARVDGRILAGTSTHALMAITQNEMLRHRHDRLVWLTAVRPGQAEVVAQTKSATPLRLGDAEALPVDRAVLMEYLETLVGQRPARIGGRDVTLVDRSSPENRQLTQDLLAQHFESLGYEVKRQCYGNGRNKGCNVEATKWGADRAKSILFTAHFDSVTRGAADDDGTGTATAMEMARLLADRDLPKTLRFVMFDQEEKGLVGSGAYVNTLSPGQEGYPVAAYNLDMIGYDSDNDGKVHIMDCGRQESTPLSAAVMEAISRAGTGLVKSDACTNRSDHASFWNKRIPAIIVSENFFGNDGNPCYHRTCDTIDRMNTDYYFRISDTMSTLALGLASAP